MSFRLSPALSKILGRMGTASKSVAQVSNPAMDGMAAALDPSSNATFVEGTVERSGPGWYDATVSTGAGATLGCKLGTGISSNLLGANECSPLMPGTRVLVYLPSVDSLYGTIIKVLPAHDTVSPAAAKAPERFVSMWELESSATVSSETAYKSPLTDPTYVAKVNANGCRPIDLMPGCFAIVNDQNVGMAVTNACAALKATPRAQVRVSMIDDNVRIVAGFFQQFGPGGVLQTFNDNGYVTEERGFTGHQCERSGMKKLGEPVFEQGPKTTLDTKSLRTSLKGVKSRLVPQQRMQSFKGWLGDMYNFFVAKPDPAQSPLTEDARSKDQGLMHMHVDANGRVLIRSAAGIALQRWDRIPVPKRLRQPWDPEGDKAPGPPPAKKPFNWDAAHPYGRSLQLRDANAWKCLDAYWRLHNQSESTGHKDFYLPEEDELQLPDDNYDEQGNGTTDFKTYDKREAGVFVEEDGSLIFRDAWGGEIVMRGGNIIMSCAGQIEIKSGKSTIIMGGHDVVVKARQSVDITATEQDIRVKGEQNVHVLSASAGVTVESKATGAPAWGGQGEDVMSAGVLVKAAGSVVMAGSTAHVAGTTGVKIESFDDSDKLGGRVEIASEYIMTHAKSAIEITAGDKTGLVLTQAAAALAAPLVTVAAQGTLAITQHAKYMIPLKWQEMGADPYDGLEAAFAEQRKRMEDPLWLMPYTPSARKEMTFTYRTSAQYGTMEATEIQGASRFTMYQPFWAFMAKRGAQTVPRKPTTWSETGILGTMPWPGTEAWGGSYVTLASENNVDSQKGTAKHRATLQSSGGALVPSSFSEYEVIPHT